MAGFPPHTLHQLVQSHARARSGFPHTPFGMPDRSIHSLQFCSPSHTVWGDSSSFWLFIFLMHMNFFLHHPSHAGTPLVFPHTLIRVCACSSFYICIESVILFTFLIRLCSCLDTSLLIVAVVSSLIVGCGLIHILLTMLPFIEWYLL